MVLRDRDYVMSQVPHVGQTTIVPRSLRQILHLATQGENSVIF